MRVFFLFFLIVTACHVQVGEPPDPPPPPYEEPEVNPFFEDSVLHRIEIEVEDRYLPQLHPDIDERIPCTFTFDGVRLENVGIRLKGFIGSRRTLEEKASFSLKFDEFVEDQEFYGERKLVLNGEVQDFSFVSRKLSHELWQRAGIPAPRTSYAEIFFNGERFGLYVVTEATDKRFLRRHFPDPDGNLYEGDGRDLSSPNLDLDTNEEENNISDLLALNDALVNLPVEGFAEAIDPYVDLEQFYRYWAVEALIYHWDGYAVRMTGEDCCSPNNYYVYNDPTIGKFVMLPHGADQVMEGRGLNYDVRMPPSPRATLAAKLFADPEQRLRLAQAIEEVLEEAWDTEAFEEILDRVEPVIQEGFDESTTREEGSQAELDQLLLARREFLRLRPDIVRDQLSQGF